MSLSDDQVRRIARLARIAIQPADCAAVAERLNRVLGLIDEMRAVDTAGIEPMAHPLEAQLPQGQRLRADEASEPAQRPEMPEGLYLVPKVIE